MDYRNICIITKQNVKTGKHRTEVIIRGFNLLGSGKSVTTVTLAGIKGDVILANNYDIFLYAGRGVSGLQGDVCIENELGEVIRGGSWKYE
jgi:hypothetical protein